ncbi:hypothetical protein BG004_007755, partial [Podila humilis]
MSNSNLTLFCLVDGETTSNAFPVEIESTKTIGSLKDVIRAKKVNDFSDVDADKLTLWCVNHSVNAANRHQPLLLTSMGSATELDPLSDIAAVFPTSLPKGTVHIIVQRPPPELKRGREHELEDPQKLPKIGDWVNYPAKDGPVDLPPGLVSLLNSRVFTPAPRDEFKRHLDNVQVGEEITLPSIGQTPKHYGEGYQGLSFFVTEQMVKMWHLLASNSHTPIRRVLSGPMGVGKSYLALFLAAKAYAEGWLILYVSDANVLTKQTPGSIATQICARFLALNKDILTVDDFQSLLLGHTSEDHEVFVNAATAVLDSLLQQNETKTLLVVDEHGALFEQDPPVPKRHPILNPLMQLAAWRQDSKGARVVLTGTAHAKFEIQYVKNDMSSWMEFVTPLSDTVFDKLLQKEAILSKAAFEGRMKECTNHVP